VCRQGASKARADEFRSTSTHGWRFNNAGLRPAWSWIRMSPMIDRSATVIMKAFAMLAAGITLFRASRPGFLFGPPQTLPPGSAHRSGSSMERFPIAADTKYLSRQPCGPW
jgi:hypothetical protein